ncbi:hypothetical protein [Nonomuraea sp. LPB2021202275-12-8]|uniref:hypothetical protein n=1 Tax=Nonomuraea sp. LPB2021202275-12-8 TaxID=3120159 RepID=UPI00300D55EB
MAQEWTVVAVEEASADDGAVPYWAIVYQVPEDVSPTGEWRYYLPKAAVAYRAAEFGMDLEEALQLIVHEPLLIGLHEAGTLQPLAPALVDAVTARSQALEQIDACRAEHGAVVTAPPGARSARAAADPLQAIREQTRLDPIAAAAIRMEIDRRRLAHDRETT